MRDFHKGSSVIFFWMKYLTTTSRRREQQKKKTVYHKTDNTSEGTNLGLFSVGNRNTPYTSKITSIVFAFPAVFFTQNRRFLTKESSNRDDWLCRQGRALVILSVGILPAAERSTMVDLGLSYAQKAKWGSICSCYKYYRSHSGEGTNPLCAIDWNMTHI